MGNDNLEDDVVIVADPFDTTDIFVMDMQFGVMKDYIIKL